MTDRPVRHARAESREVVELKGIKSAHPELASAVDMQLELVEVLRRVKARVPLPWIQHETAWLEQQVQSARSAVRFSDIPLDWSDFRLALRQTADILYRHDAMDRADHEHILSLSRDGNALEPLVKQWYFATSHAEGSNPDERTPAGSPASLDQVLLLSIRPFLARCAEALLPRPEFSGWHHRHCPICGWEPDFGVITPNADRRLICGRCLGQWTFDQFACPFCENHDRARITSFATRDGRYRVYGCDVCRKYLKAYDARNASRPVMVSVDTIATLPLDAAAMQKGYDG
jgi:Protein involved in formate dehydrogenase formation